MQLGMIGLGRMGNGMTERLREADHDVRTYDPKVESRTAGSLEELKSQLDAPRAFWIMVPAGEVTESVFRDLLNLADEGDTIVDGGNSNFRDSQRRHREAEAKGLHFVDAGVSGGIWGLQVGFCLMVGGDTEAVQRLEPIFTSLAPENGYAHVGPVGAGHFVKMVHNGIEYGLLQAYAEGFALMHKAEEFNLDLHQIAEVWRYGSVVRSWLLDLAALALDEPEFEKIRGYVEDSGEGRWTIDEAIARGVSTPVMAISLFERFQSREPDAFSAKIIAALRNQFGGHKFFEESAAAEAN